MLQEGSQLPFLVPGIPHRIFQFTALFRIQGNALQFRPEIVTGVSVYWDRLRSIP
jgi:hypothetical protein